MLYQYMLQTVVIFFYLMIMLIDLWLVGTIIVHGVKWLRKIIRSLKERKE